MDNNNNWTKKKIIHKIWINFKGTEEGKNPSIVLLNKQSRCQLMNPDYHIKMWNEEEADALMRREFPNYYAMWKSYTFPIQRVDTLKYFLMYLYGGLYMDMDIECLKPFGDYFDLDKVYLVEETSCISPYKFNNFLIGSPQKHPFWLYVFKELEESMVNMQNFDTMHILESSGPGVVQRAYEKYCFRNSNEDFHILPKELFNPCDVCGNMSSSVNSAYLVHESNVSWSESAKFMAFFMCNKTIIIIIVIFLALLFIYSSE